MGTTLTERPWGFVLASRFRLSLAILLGTVAYGTFGYYLVEGWPLSDSFYMTVITLTTVGFREVQPLDVTGQLFTVSIILLGLVAFFSAVGAGTQLLASGELGRSLERRRAQKRVSRLRDHYVICGFGRVGRSAAEEFESEGIDYVVVDRDEDVTAALDQAGIASLTADPVEEAVLVDAGIEHARGLICAVDSDAVNVYITITARALNAGLTIVARASRPESVETLRRAGADRVVSPYALSGKRMAFLSLRPSVVDFIDMVTVAPDLRLEEIVVRGGSPLDGVALGEARAAHPGTTILALRREGGDLVATPQDDVLLSSGDLVIALGRAAELESMIG